MFQDFSSSASPEQGRVRIPLLREELQEQGLSGFILPRADEYRGENLAPYAERLAWLTGFTGSAGTAMILRNKAAILVDGRYTLQVAEQVDSTILSPVDFPATTPAQWLEQEVEEGDIIGFDPWLHTPGEVTRLLEACKSKGASLRPLAHNPIDSLWDDQPPKPAAPIRPHALELAGVAANDKIETIAENLKGKADATFITQGDSVAWLFNIRGDDVPRAPLPLAFALIFADGTAALITNPDKITDAARAHLPQSVSIIAEKDLAAFIETQSGPDKTWLLDLSLVPHAVWHMIEATGSTILDGPDPCLKPKAAKNEAELEGMRKAHRRDGVALTRFLAWFERMAGATPLTEIACATALEDFRRATGCLEDISFDTISGAGPNGAICHYRVNEASNRQLDEDSLYLIDSGAQYPDGTTDITRTLPVGAPSNEMKDRFTRVLKGMIAVTLARFPKGTSGAQIDSLARMPLWQVGLDYAHGTGHGVGSYLCVHEGPQRIAKTGTTPIEAGNILSNEPGYYKAGHWGIRIENLLIVEPASAIAGGDEPMHSFETLTLCPINRHLIDPTLLSGEELGWLNDYHERVFAELSADLDEEDRAWLAEATKPIRF